jgi:outer membrane protein TolC
VTTRTIAGLFLLAAVAGPGELRAQAARATFPDEPLEALVAEALGKNPDVAAAVADSEAAGFRIAPARTLPDPFVSVSYQNDGTSITLGERDMTFLGARFSQTLPWPGKLRLAGEEARQRAEEVRVGAVGRARLAVEARVRRAWYEYLLSRALLDLIEDRSRSWRDISAIVRERYAVGLGIQQDVLRSQVEVLRLDEARAEQAVRVASLRAELNRMTSRPQDSALETPARLDFRGEVPDLESMLRAVREKSPEIAALERAIEAGRIRVSLARKDLLPDFTASAGPMYRGGLDPMWQVGLGVTLPIYSGSRQRPRRDAAEADLRSERARASSVALELELLTRQRYRALNAALEVAKLYRDGVLPVDQLSLESAVASYRAGKVPFVTVLEALNTLFSDRAIYLTRLAESEGWRVSIDEADPQPAGAMSAAAPASPPGEGNRASSAGGAMSSSAPMR